MQAFGLQEPGQQPEDAPTHALRTKLHSAFQAAKEHSAAIEARDADSDIDIDIDDDAADDILNALLTAAQNWAETLVRDAYFGVAAAAEHESSDEDGVAEQEQERERESSDSNEEAVDEEEEAEAVELLFAQLDVEDGASTVEGAMSIDASPPPPPSQRHGLATAINVDPTGSIADHHIHAINEDVHQQARARMTQSLKLDAESDVMAHFTDRDAWILILREVINTHIQRQHEEQRENYFGATLRDRDVLIAQHAQEENDNARRIQQQSLEYWKESVRRARTRDEAVHYRDIAAQIEDIFGFGRDQELDAFVARTFGPSR